jgi:hypothetical protein
MIDLSGGFDSRTVLTILLNSGINMNEILVNSINDTLHTHEEDFKIAINISKKIGFKVNNLRLDKNGTKLNTKDSIFLSIYTKLGFHKELYLETMFYSKPIFSITGYGGEDIRGLHHIPIKKYINEICSSAKKINGHIEEFYKSLLKRNKRFNNDHEIAADLYYKGRVRHHFGKASLESFYANIYKLYPLIDSDINKLNLIIMKSQIMAS